MNVKILAIAALASSGTAYAQEKIVPRPLPQVQLPEQVLNPSGKQPELDIELSADSTERAVGCVQHQVYNIQGLNRISTAFVLSTSSGNQTFNFEGTAIRHVPEGDPLPLASSLETKRWDRILTTLERAAAANKPILIDYRLPGREVYGMHVQWSGNCAP